jgi:hypothetical protein
MVRSPLKGFLHAIKEQSFAFFAVHAGAVQTTKVSAFNKPVQWDNKPLPTLLAFNFNADSEVFWLVIIFRL